MDPANRGIVRFRKIASLVCQWIAERGNLPHTLAKDQCPWLVQAPTSLQAEFEVGNHPVSTFAVAKTD
jgi:hypothetical protein